VAGHGDVRRRTPVRCLALACARQWQMINGYGACDLVI
jgi:hypothetical protein